MKPFQLFNAFFLVLAFTGCERKSAEESVKPGDDVGQSVVPAFEEIHKREEALRKQASSDTGADYSREWSKLLQSHGPAFKSQLIASIREAKSITLTEHSHETDFYEINQPLPEHPPYFEYQTVKLTEDQKTTFLSDVERMDGTTVLHENSKKCGFEPHHLLKFVFNESKQTQMSICFVCDEVEWNAPGIREPKGLLPTLRKLVEDAGLKPDRDWRALAKERGTKSSE